MFTNWSNQGESGLAVLPYSAKFAFPANFYFFSVLFCHFFFSSSNLTLNVPHIRAHSICKWPLLDNIILAKQIHLQVISSWTGTLDVLCNFSE